MIRSAFGKVALLALTTAIAGVTMAGCSSDIDSKKTPVADGKHGEAGLNLQPVSGVTIDTVTYTVTQGAGGAVVKTGNLAVPGTGADFSFGVPLPVGTDYHLSLSATSVDGKVTCVGGLPAGFNIVANQTIDITPKLTCTDITTGQPIVLVDVINTACPDLSFDYVVATPKSAKLGSNISLLASAVSASGKTISYSWTTSAPLGAITPPTSKTPSLACTTPGALVTVTVTAANGECTNTLSTKVSCVNAACGDGVIVAPETCDTGANGGTPDPTCPADCTRPVCGDGSVEAPETCEPGNTALCGANCQARVEACGDTFIGPTEVCDGTTFPAGTAPGSQCTNNCHTITPPVVTAVCGDGTKNGSEICDPPFSANNCGDLHAGSAAGATAACDVIETGACTTCVAAAGVGDFDCGTLTGNAAAGPGAGQSRSSLCYKLLDCIYDTNCGAADSFDCYCGTSGAACQTGGANGKCRAEIEASLESTAFGDIGTRLGDPGFAGGTAVVRVDGSRDTCGTVCGSK